MTIFKDYIDQHIATHHRTTVTQFPTIALTDEQLYHIGCGIADGLSAKQLQALGHEVGIALGKSLFHSHTRALTEGGTK